ncbi:uncharacterized protein LOC130647077 [Hydractinia symbiolongicarpus]|uniref:uncharacterized protein LOC130647076 n=1 Tax=Hydractinia symbiolongicarpus TaxID=13093 RepID=UPI00254B4C02|nr:uncharacterized protein LOC130647076 [Hydractinia symbiolongicarpus]XP_057308786.1 uncharacterized protein LOC130647077 [Hydractinia symbiolongicarpus]
MVYRVASILKNLVTTQLGLNMLKDNMENITFTVSATRSHKDNADVSVDDSSDSILHQPVPVPIIPENTTGSSTNVEKIAEMDSNSRKRKVRDEAVPREELDDEIQSLNLMDNVPNKSGKVVTLKEVLDKSAEDEGYVDFIATHRDNNGITQYQVKWIGYRSLTWEAAENLPKSDLEQYFIKKM